jgi:hypothetical protein
MRYWESDYWCEGCYFEEVKQVFYIRVMLFFILLIFSCAPRLTEKYAKVVIFGNREELIRLNELGLPLDHITLYRDSAVVGYFSYYDLRAVKRNGYRYRILERNVGKKSKTDR